jgi:hypothetical protein
MAEATSPWTTYPILLQVGWVKSRLQVGGTVQLSDVRPLQVIEPEAEEDAEAIFADMPEEPLAEKRFEALLAQIPPESRWLGLANPTLRLDLTERRTGENWPLPVTIHPLGLAAAFSTDIDPRTIAAGNRLEDGLWDLYVHFGVLGLAMRRRATLTKERRPGPILPEPAAKGALPTMAAYFTQRSSGLCLDVGLIKHPKLRDRPKPPAVPRKKPSFARRVVRKLRRMIRS